MTPKERKKQDININKKQNRLEHILTEFKLNLCKAKLKLIRKLLKENIAEILNKNIQKTL